MTNEEIVKSIENVLPYKKGDKVYVIKKKKHINDKLNFYARKMYDYSIARVSINGFRIRMIDNKIGCEFLLEYETTTGLRRDFEVFDNLEDAEKFLKELEN